VTALQLAALAAFALSRIAYAGGVGAMLAAQKRNRAFTRTAGLEAGYARFRSRAATLMNIDGVLFVVLCLATAGTLDAAAPRAALVAIGVLLCLIGGITKLWAAKLLGSKGYHWYDFFAPHEPKHVELSGPYRIARNPMYTIGYLQTYGLALILASWPGLLASAFAQAAILTFYFVVEKPHFDELTRGERAAASR
jgi:protein-S-isoprenylcysteine O-methyltransferase Ste14